MTYFPDDLRVELERSWFDEDYWWMVLHLAEDAVREEFGDCAADGIRWLTVMRQRTHFGADAIGWWCCMTEGGQKVLDAIRSSPMSNYVTCGLFPQAFPSFPATDRMNSIDYFLTFWCGAPQVTRDDCWTTANLLRTAQ